MRNYGGVAGTGGGGGRGKNGRGWTRLRLLALLSTLAYQQTTVVETTGAANEAATRPWKRVDFRRAGWRQEHAAHAATVKRSPEIRNFRSDSKLQLGFLQTFPTRICKQQARVYYFLLELPEIPLDLDLLLIISETVTARDAVNWW